MISPSLIVYNERMYVQPKILDGSLRQNIEYNSENGVQMFLLFDVV